MSLSAGTATLTVNSDGTVTPGGAGLAATIAAAWLANSSAYSDPSKLSEYIAALGLPFAQYLIDAIFVAPSNAIAAGIVAALTTDAVVTVPVAANALDSGVPSANRSLTGTIG